MNAQFTDIHCHILPGLDDGPAAMQESLRMAEMAVRDGIRRIVATPHQCGSYRSNRGVDILQAVDEFQEQLQRLRIDLELLPGADVRIEPDLIAKVKYGEVLTVANRRRHLLLELPHELYFPIDKLLEQLDRAGLVGILTHPERNRQLLQTPQIVAQLVDRGCLMQVTAGSLRGSFGPDRRAMALWMLDEGLAHFIATDAHGANRRRPVMQDTFAMINERCGAETADLLCCRNPAAVVDGNEVAPGRTVQRKRGALSWLRSRKTA